MKPSTLLFGVLSFVTHATANSAAAGAQHSIAAKKPQPSSAHEPPTKENMLKKAESIWKNVLADKPPTKKHPNAFITKKNKNSIEKIIDAYSREQKSFVTISKPLIHGEKPPTAMSGIKTKKEQRQRAKDFHAGQKEWESTVDTYISEYTKAIQSRRFRMSDEELYLKLIGTAANILKLIYNIDHEGVTLACTLNLRKSVGILLQDYLKKLRLQTSPYKPKQIRSAEDATMASLETRGQYIQFVVQGILDGRQEAYELLNSNIIEIVASNGTSSAPPP